MAEKQMDPVVTHQAFVNSVLQEKVKQGKLDRMYIPEVLQAINDAEGADKKAILMNNATPNLLELLRLTYDPNIGFRLTEKEVRSIKFELMDIDDYDLAPATMFTEARRLKLFSDKSPTPLTKEKVEAMMSNMFSAMHPDDIEYICQMHGKVLDVDGLTEELVRECFPRLLQPVGGAPAKPEPQSDKVDPKAASPKGAEQPKDEKPKKKKRGRPALSPEERERRKKISQKKAAAKRKMKRQAEKKKKEEAKAKESGDAE